MQLNEETCPVPESVLGQLYRANPHGLDELIATVPPQTRAMLAVYCYRRDNRQPAIRTHFGALAETKR
jgi:hypothetical protein